MQFDLLKSIKLLKSHCVFSVTAQFTNVKNHLIIKIYKQQDLHHTFYFSLYNTIIVAITIMVFEIQN